MEEKVFDIFQCYAIEAVVDPLGRLLIMLTQASVVILIAQCTLFALHFSLYVFLFSSWDRLQFILEHFSLAMEVNSFVNPHLEVLIAF